MTATTLIGAFVDAGVACQRQGVLPAALHVLAVRVAADRSEPAAAGSGQVAAVEPDVADALALIGVLDAQAAATVGSVELLTDDGWANAAVLAGVGAPSPAVRSNVITLMRKRAAGFAGFPRAVPS